MIIPYIPKAEVSPHYPCALDTETRANGDVFAIGFAWCDDGSRQYKSFDNWQEWINWYTNDFLIKHKEAFYRKIFAANGANFDWISLVDWSHKNGMLDTMQYIASDSRGIGVNIKIGKHTIRLRDLFALIPGSLAGLSKTFNVEHAKIGIHELPESLYCRDRELFDDYLKHDTLAVQEIVYRFHAWIIENHGNIGELPMTIASLAMRLFRSSMNDNIMTTWNEKLKVLERSAYRGGRVSCFETGQHNVRIDDINSLYPSVMHDAIVPASYRGGFVTEYSGKLGVYTGSFEQTNRNYPPLLYDSETNDFSYSGSGTFMTPEIDELVSRGGIFKCSTGYVYHDTQNLFQTFISNWWSVRQKAIENNDTASAFISKILMNSLYGKFGQKETSTSCKLLTSEQQKNMLKRGTPFSSHGDYSLVETPTHSEHTFVGIAACITSYARVQLYRLMCDVVDHGGRVVYVDTDSVHYVAEDSLELSKNLGGLKEEYVGNVVYLGRKLYAKENGEIKAKGIGRLNRSSLSFHDFKNLQNGGTKRIDYDTFPTWKEVLINDKIPCKLISRYRTIRNTKTVAL